MEDTLCSFETSRLAKEKGIDIGHTLFSYEAEHTLSGTVIIPELNLVLLHEDWKSDINIFTQSLLQKYLREKYNIHVNVCLDQTAEPKFCVELFKYRHFGNYEKLDQGEWFLYKTFEEALEVGLQAALKSLK